MLTFVELDLGIAQWNRNSWLLTYCFLFVVVCVTKQARLALLCPRLGQFFSFWPGLFRFRLVKLTTKATITMGKKKKRGNYKDSQEDQDDVSTDEDVNNDKSDLADLPNCPHVGKAVNPSSIKKALKPAWLRIGACGACKRANAPTRAPPVNLVKGKKSRFDWLRSLTIATFRQKCKEPTSCSPDTRHSRQGPWQIQRRLDVLELWQPDVWLQCYERQQPGRSLFRPLQDAEIWPALCLCQYRNLGSLLLHVRRGSLYRQLQEVARRCRASEKSGRRQGNLGFISDSSLVDAGSRSEKAVPICQSKQWFATSFSPEGPRTHQPWKHLLFQRRDAVPFSESSPDARSRPALSEGSSVHHADHPDPDPKFTSTNQQNE